MMWVVLAWVCLAVLIYTWVGYPLLLILLARLAGRRPCHASAEPTVSLIVAACNEERAIEDKLENCLQLDYPAEKLEVLVASDGSTDRTNDLVSQYAARDRRVRLVAHRENRGKSLIQNDAVRTAHGDVLVFSDATALYERDSLQALVRNFADPSVGCVAGVVVDRAKDWTPVSEANLTYFAYDNFLRRKEAELGILHGISGAIFAVRRELYVPLKPLQGDDLDTPLNVIRQGYRVLWEPSAVAKEQIASSVLGKFRQKRRVVIQGLSSILLCQRDLLNPFRCPLLAVSLVSHRLLRYVMPFFLAALLTASVGLWLDGSVVGVALVAAEAACAGAAVVGGILYLRRRTVTFFTLPFYFCVLSAAAAAGTIAFLAGKRFVRWAPDR